MLKDFLRFVKEYNVIGLAVGVIVATYMGKWVDSLVKDVLMPAIFNPMLVAANAKDLESWVVGGSIKLGLFLSNTITVVIVLFVVYLVMRYVMGQSEVKKI